MADIKQSLLIVDDTPANLDLLSHILSVSYTIYVATNGSRALEIVRSEPISLVLLDVQMPVMDGFAVCKAIKEDPITARIPVIFLTALTGESNEEQGLALGAVDYITKPFVPHLVRARVATHVQLFTASQELQREKVAVEKAFQKQCELEKVRDNLVHMIIHDLRSPLSGILGGTDLVIELLSDRHEPEKDGEVISILSSLKRVSEDMASLISTILDINRLESGSMPIQYSDFRILETLQTVVKSYEYFNEQQHHIQICTTLDPSMMISTDKSLLTRIIGNFLSNALKHSPKDKPVEIDVTSTGDNLLSICIKDYGIGIPPEVIERIFDKYWQAEEERRFKGASSGLGLSFCKLAGEAIGGKIFVSSKSGEGS